MKRFPAWLVAPTRRPLLYMAGGVVLLVGGAFVFNAIVQSQARHTATVAAQVANEKVNKARDLQEESVWAAALAACGRGNIIRAAITLNVENISAFELAAEHARRDAARTDVTAAQKAIDLKAAANYRRLRLRLKPIPPVDCAATYPEPHPALGAK